MATGTWEVRTLFGNETGADKHLGCSCGKQLRSSSRRWSSERRNLAMRFPLSIISSKIAYAFSSQIGYDQRISIAGPIRRTTVETKIDSRSKERKLSIG